MTDLAAERTRLEQLVIDFTEAFNRDDLDGVMSYLTDDAVYDEFNGTVNRGKAAIRAAFVPQFRGDYGKLRFHTEDVFVDPVTRRGLVRWLCTLDTKRGRAGWRGLDILHFDGDRIAEKLTYAKAKAPLLNDTEEPAR